MLIAEVPKNQKALVDMNGTLPSVLVHRPPKVITPTSRHAPRARLRQGKLPRAHIECAPTDSVSDKGRKLHAGHRPLRGGSARHKNVEADSISARARLRQDKPPRAHIECAPTDSVSDQQGHLQKNAATLFYGKITWLRLLFWLCV